MKLDLGCGVNKPEGFVGIDLLPTADIVADLREGIPYADDSIEAIRAKDFFEHMPDLIFNLQRMLACLAADGPVIG